jgi:transposase-like protein
MWSPECPPSAPAQQPSTQLHIFGNSTFIEQDHRRIKQRVRPMLGFKRFETAAVTIRGIELAAKIKKQQFNLKALTEQATTAPEIWAAVLAA